MSEREVMYKFQNDLRCLLVVVAIIITGNSTAQWYNPDAVNKKAADIYAQAYQEAQAEKYYSAIDKLNQSLIIEPKLVDAYLSRAGIYANLRKYDSSVADFDKAIQLDSQYCKIYLLPYSLSLAGLGRFEDALKAVNKFLTIEKLKEYSLKSANYRKRSYEFAIDYARKHNTKNYIFSPVNVGSGINTTDLEYYPSLTIDGKKMIFTRRIKNDEDFYESNYVNGEWATATPVKGKLNTNLNEGAQNISQDGEWIVFTGCNYPEGMGSCDLYISYKTKNGWTEAQNLGPNVNSDTWESSPSLSPDKRSLYFSSSRQGGYGGRDIWVSHRNTDGSWSYPENLGPVVNTSADEGSAFMYPDNQTLFINSNGHQGYGMTDLFYTKRLNDSTWSEPVNLGYPINTIDDEGSLIVSSDGVTAYYASDGGNTKGGLDIFSFKLREDIRPPKTLWVKGKVFDVKTKQGLPSSVELTDINTRNVISLLQTDEEGNYLTTLPVGEKYAFNVNRKGYLFFSESFDMTHPEKDSVYTKDIPLQPIQSGAAIVLKNIFFDTKKAILKDASTVELDKLIQLLVDNPKMVILISGHTDAVGKPADNLKLSNERAMAVVKYILASKKISKTRLQYKGFGATKPVADNKTEEGKAQNRRTELTVLSN